MHHVELNWLCIFLVVENNSLIWRAVDNGHALWSLFSQSLWFYNADKTYPTEKNKVLCISLFPCTEMGSTVQHKV